jgi:hypothetical protein
MVTVRLGDRSAVGAFEVVTRADKPIIRATPYLARDGVSRPDSPLLTGITFRVTLAGFEPSQDVKLVLYSGDNTSGFSYRAVIDTLRTDDRGEAIYLLRTHEDDPPGTYAIQTVPESRGVYGSGDQGAVFCVRQVETDGCGATRSVDDLARGIVLEAGRALAAAVSADEAAVSDLGCAYGGAALSRVEQAVDALREADQYLDARVVVPIEVHSARITSQQPIGDIDEVEVFAGEQWEARLMHSDGSVLEDRSGRREWRYVIVRRFGFKAEPTAEAPVRCGNGWLIVDAELLGSTVEPSARGG